MADAAPNIAGATPVAPAVKAEAPAVKAEAPAVTLAPAVKLAPGKLAPAALTPAIALATASLNWRAMTRAPDKEDPAQPGTHKYRVAVTPSAESQKVNAPAECSTSPANCHYLDLGLTHVVP